MLIQFKVKNYLSFKEEVLFSLESASSTGEHLENVFKEGKEELLKSSVIYGANASGKSNLIKAIGFIKFLVLKDYNLKEEGIDVIPFKLSEKTEKKPSFFEIVFISKNIKYEYNFEVNQAKVVSEELYESSPNRKPIFKRKGNKIEIGTRLKKNKNLPSVKERELYLSTLARVFDEIENNIVSWFKKLEIVSSLDLNLQYTLKKIDKNNLLKEKILNYLKKADINVEDILFEVENVDIQKIPNNVLANFGIDKTLPLTPKTIKRGKLSFLHQKYDKDNNPTSLIPFHFLQEESSGTRQLFNLLGPIFDVIESNKVLIIDELENSLHPLLLKFIVDIFNSEENKGAQLIFTAHDVSLLSDNCLRRDQIWFTEKDKYGATSLYSLIDFKNTRENQDFLKKYLLGNFGAIPFIDNL